MEVKIGVQHAHRELVLESVDRPLQLVPGRRGLVGEHAQAKAGASKLTQGHDGFGIRFEWNGVTRRRRPAVASAGTPRPRSICTSRLGSPGSGCRQAAR